MKLVRILSLASPFALSLSMVGCAASTEPDSEEPAASDSANASDDEPEVESTAQDLIASPGQGCRWVLRRGQFCPRILGDHTATCYPAPRHPGFHWQRVCRYT